MQYKKLKENPKIWKNAMVSVKYLGKTTEITFCSICNNEGSRIMKVDGEHYVDTRTGEIKKFQVKEKMRESRLASPESLRRTLKEIKELIQTYVTDARRVRWCTVTYQENMSDKRRLHEDFRRFIQKLRYHCKKNSYGEFEYIAVCEPQGRGSFHIHMFLIWKNVAPYIANEVFREIWGHGYVSIKAIKDIENIGGYFQAYLTDLEISEEKAEYFAAEDIKVVETDSSEKRFLKGGRLHIYPRYFNILRHSRGVKKPEKVVMTYEEALKEVSGKELRYQTAFQLTSENGFQMLVSKMEFR